jgi:RimJ/RimL family protein N-acetyltransferase
MPPAIKEVILRDNDLCLRPPRREEAPLYALWWSDPEVAFGFCSEGRTADEIADAFPELESEAADIGHWIDYVIEADERPVGYTWLSGWDLDGRCCELNLLIGEQEYRGRRLGRRTIRLLCAWAFPTMDLARISLCPRDDHYPAIRAYQSAGARYGEIRPDVMVWRGETVCFRELYFQREDFVAEVREAGTYAGAAG